MHGLLERLAFESMYQGDLRHSENMVDSDCFEAEIGSIGLSGAAQNEIAAMAIHIEFDIDGSDQFGDVARHRNLAFELSCVNDALA